jgi:hypothetical protein
MGSIRNRDAIGEPDDNGSGTKIRGKACKNGETGVKAYGKFQPSGISGKLVITMHRSQVPPRCPMAGTFHMDIVITSSPEMPDGWNFPYAFTPVLPFLHAFPLIFVPLPLSSGSHIASLFLMLSITN